MTPQMVFAYNHPSKKAAIYGEVDDEGEVTFAVQAAEDSPIRGTELFRRMMLAFGENAKRVFGAWTKGQDPSINIDEVNKLTGTGVPFLEAIQRTWTVKRAREFGFTQVRIVGLPVGVPGANTKIMVLIEK